MAQHNTVSDSTLLLSLDQKWVLHIRGEVSESEKAFIVPSDDVFVHDYDSIKRLCKLLLM